MYKSCLGSGSNARQIVQSTFPSLVVLFPHGTCCVYASNVHSWCVVDSICYTGNGGYGTWLTVNCTWVKIQHTCERIDIGFHNAFNSVNTI